MVADLTGMPLSNCSLLDEATAAAEAMTMCTAQSRQKKLKFLVSVSSPAGLRLWQASLSREAAYSLQRARGEPFPPFRSAWQATSNCVLEGCAESSGQQCCSMK